MSDESGKGKPVQIQVDLDPEVAQGMYVNMAMVNHTETEFTLDFIYVQPQSPKAKVRARIISSPKHTKRLLVALKDAVERFEAKHGALELGDPPEPSDHLLN